ncbi:hypothetical protein KPH14_006310 [Odynerus spinipes]|uniref:Essential protein Yae1 N-terminal domain-containing protein n=1 Tax=Odynerus spinipes TaxID=1348599 RepID=A0AAD9S0F6_9HYME|nr:hypothetical protein KPH14_006310 [Odynerus spinipes]
MEDFLSSTIDPPNKMEDEDLSIASKNWNRLVTGASTVGYKEGIEDGQEAVFQEGFNLGYKDAFNIAFTLGRYKGVCYICNEESQNKHLDGRIEDMPFSDIQQKQKTYSINIIKTLHNYVESIMAENNIDTHDLAFDTQF